MRKSSKWRRLWMLVFCFCAIGFINGKTMVVEAAHSHPLCGTTCICEELPYSHGFYTWQAWDGESSFSGSNVYLTQDATWPTGAFTVRGSVHICLNGHTINFPDGISIAYGTSLTFCDCTDRGKVTGANIFVNGSAYVYGGTIATDLQIDDRAVLYVIGGSMTEIYNHESGTVNFGYIKGRSPKVTYELYNAGTMKISGGNISDLDCQDSSVTEISGNPSIKRLSGYGGSIYLSGKVDIGNAYFGSDTSVFASNKAKTEYYEGTPLTISPRAGVLVQNVKDKAHLAYIKVLDTIPHKDSLIGTDLVCEVPSKTGTCGIDLKWALWEDGTLELYGSGEMEEYKYLSDRPWPSEIKKLVVGDQVTSISDSAFELTKLESITFGSASLSIGNYAFSRCYNLTDIDFGTGTILPGHNVFHHCDNLRFVHIPAGVKMDESYWDIGSGYDMFMYCENLETAVVDAAYVGPYVFESCYNLKQVTFTDPNVEFYCLESADLSGHIFNTQGVKSVDIEVIGYECSKAHLLTTKKKYFVYLTFKSIEGDTSKHNTVVTSGTPASCTSTGLSDGSKCSKCDLILKAQETIPANGHDYKEEVTKSASCVETGEKTLTCNVCGDVVTESMEVDSTNHVGDSVLKDQKDASCTEAGYTGDTYCGSCDTLLISGKEISKLGHLYDDGVVTKESNCKEKGIRTFTCSACKDTYTEELSLSDKHGELEVRGRKEAQIGVAGYTGDTYCIICGSMLEEGVVIDPLPEPHVHSYQSSVTSEAGCTTDGVMTYSCNCGDFYTEVIPATGHKDLILKFKKSASCTIDGYTGDTYCNSCGNLMEEGSIIPSLGHAWDEGEETSAPGCVTDGVTTFSCSRCNETKTESIPAKGHVETILKNEKETSCKEAGYTGDAYCKACDTLLIPGKEIPKSDHTYAGGVVTKEATCKEKGIKTYTCIVCNDTYSEELPLSKQHGELEVRNQKEAQIGVAGYTGDTYCKVCDSLIEKGKVLEPLPEEHVHSYTSKVTVEASCKNTGLMTYSCLCGDSYTEEIPKKDHQWDSGKVTIEPSQIQTGLKVYTCMNCGMTDTKMLEKLPLTVILPENAPFSDPISQDKSGMIGQNISTVDQRMAGTVSDEVSGSIYQLLKLRYKSIGTTSLTIQWSAIPGATSYVVYGARCGSAFTKLGTVCTVNFIQNGITKGTYYKYFVVAVKDNTVMATSKTIHVATSGGKVGNAKKLKLNKSKVTLKIKKSFKLKVKTTPVSKKLKVKKHRGNAYESSNPMIATVSGSGKVVAKAKGTCYVYAYAQDGVYARIKVTVK